MSPPSAWMRGFISSSVAFTFFSVSFMCLVHHR
jgi:hypothetical protein